MNNIMYTKARQAQVCYENLKKQIGAETDAEVIFNIDDARQSEITSACFKHNPFPSVLKAVLLKLRMQAVNRLYQDEKVLQTGPTAAILAMNQVLANQVKAKRNHSTKTPTVYCDVDLAGLQVVRLYMMGYEGNNEFITSRYQSAIRVDNALNGSFYKYKTKDNRYFSAHVYYESQKARMMKLLQIKKDPNQFVFGTLPFDKITTANKIKGWNAETLEEASFEAQACGCMLRTRKEWEETEVGKAVCEMPLYRFTQVNESAPVIYPEVKEGKGPLHGLKVLDLTHIIAGPACTRLLAEAGADVLMVRRGKYTSQEQAMLELDGWSGKNSIQLDFNKEEQLNKAKELVKEADIVICSYQYGALTKFGLDEEGIRKLNPNVIYGSLVCFSDTVWRNRPGWAPCGEDITGLSVRNGSLEKPVNLNGVPLDYIPGMILFSGIMKAILAKMEQGGGYSIYGSLTRGGYWLHECTDLIENNDNLDILLNKTTTSIQQNIKKESWKEIQHPITNTAVGTVYFPAPAIAIDDYDQFATMHFTDGNTGFKGEQ